MQGGVAEQQPRKRRYPVAKVKGGWTAVEDDHLRRLVDQYSEGNWSVIARALNAEMGKPDACGRIGKQCRERWNHHLRPGIRTDAWQDDEEALLVEAHMKYGNKWSDIARCIPGRTENAIKNHWNATLRRKDPTGHKGHLTKANAPTTVTLKAYMQRLNLLPPPSSEDCSDLDLPTAPHRLHTVAAVTHNRAARRSLPPSPLAPAGAALAAAVAAAAAAEAPSLQQPMHGLAELAALASLASNPVLDIQPLDIPHADITLQGQGLFTVGPLQPSRKRVRYPPAEPCAQPQQADAAVAAGAGPAAAEDAGSGPAGPSSSCSSSVSYTEDETPSASAPADTTDAPVFSVTKRPRNQRTMTFSAAHADALIQHLNAPAAQPQTQGAVGSVPASGSPTHAAPGPRGALFEPASSSQASGLSEYTGQTAPVVLAAPAPSSFSPVHGVYPTYATSIFTLSAAGAGAGAVALPQGAADGLGVKTPVVAAAAVPAPPHRLSRGQGSSNALPTMAAATAAVPAAAAASGAVAAAPQQGEEDPDIQAAEIMLALHAMQAAAPAAPAPPAQCQLPAVLGAQGYLGPSITAIL